MQYFIGQRTRWTYKCFGIFTARMPGDSNDITELIFTMRIIFLVILLLHGLIHLMGFFKAFQLAEIEQLNLPLSKLSGLFWLLTSLLMLASGTAYLWNMVWWCTIVVLAVILSQVLILMYWQDAKAGTIANLLILIFIWLNHH